MPTESERMCMVRIGPEQAGLPVLAFVAERFTYLAPAQWQEELAAGRLRINGERVDPAQQLVAADLLSYRWPVLVEPPVHMAFELLYEDEDLLVVNKPAPLPCHPGGRYFRHTLWSLLQEQTGLEKPMLVNRLDRETSGLVLVAKNRQAARICGKQWQERQVDKGYLVLVEGAFPEQECQASGVLALDPESLIRKKWKYVPHPSPAPTGARQCLTHFRKLACGQGLSLLEARPLTGRCHQIRATLYGLGFPVVGDKIYGVDERFFLRFMADGLTDADQQRLRLPRQALHGASLRFRHPGDQRLMEFSCPLPLDIAGLIREGGCKPKP